MTATIGTLKSHVVLNCLIFPQNSNDIVPYARHFLPVKFFFPSTTYILLDVSLCSFAEYFYELCRILASP